MYAFLCVQNKKKRKLTWREAKDSVPADTSSEIGQLMLYLVAAHFKRFSVSKKTQYSNSSPWTLHERYESKHVNR